MFTRVRFVCYLKINSEFAFNLIFRLSQALNLIDIATVTEIVTVVVVANDLLSR